MKTAVVTGASGFIGKALTRRLLAEDTVVYAVLRRVEAVEDLRCSRLIPVELDFSHYNRLADVIGEKIDVFLHFAWSGVSDENSRSLASQTANITASAMAMEQAKILGAGKFLFAESSYQYRMEPYIQDGGKIFLQKNLYGKAKEAAGGLLRAWACNNDITYNAVLFTNVFGVEDFSNRSTNVILRRLMSQSKVDLITGEHFHDWVYIDDAVNGVLSVLEKGRAGVSYYIGQRKLRTFREIITAARDAVAPEVTLQFGSYADEAYIDYSKIDLDALYRDTGFECQADFAESIQKTAAWLAAERTEKSMERTKENNKIQKVTGGGVTPEEIFTVFQFIAIGVYFACGRKATSLRRKGSGR